MKKNRPVGIIIQARMESRRLPGKVLEPVGDRLLLEWLLVRLGRCQRVDGVVVATTTSPKDDRLAQRCREWGSRVFRGSEEDVLSRYAACARAHGFATVVRVTADNPLTDPEGIDAVIQALDHGAVVYAHTKHRRGYPYGTGAEAVRAPVLDELESLATEPADREHVTTYLLRHPERFATEAVEAPERLAAPGVFLTVDYPEDLELLRRLHGVVPLSPETPLTAYLDALAAHPEIAALNRHRHVGFDVVAAAADRR